MELVKRILLEYDYHEDEGDGKIGFFSKKDEDYYMVADYSKTELANFSENETTLKAYDLMSKYKDVYPDLSKNTSLFVCVNVDDYESFVKDQRNEVYSIEEDPYVFRKYVILYSTNNQNSLMLKTTDEILDLAQRIDSFNEYEDRLTRYSNSDYFLALQILIKVPFLELSKDAIELVNLPDRLNATLSSLQAIIVNDTIDGENISVISEQDVTSLESNTVLDRWLDNIDQKIGDM